MSTHSFAYLSLLHAYSSSASLLLAKRSAPRLSTGKNKGSVRTRVQLEIVRAKVDLSRRCERQTSRSCLLHHSSYNARQVVHAFGALVSGF